MPQRLERDVKRRLGRDYLAPVLNGLEGRQQVRAEFGWIQNHLSAHNNFQIPAKVIMDLGLYGTDARWRYANPFGGDLAMIFLGNDPKNSGDITPANSTKSIEIANRVDYSKHVELHEPILVRIGGIMKDRIVGLTYDCDSGKLTDINISVSEEEIGKLRDRGVSGHTEQRLFVLLKPEGEDTPPRNHYDTAAIITEGMENELARIHPDRHHTKALICRVYDKSVTFGYDPNVIYMGESPAEKAAKQLGFYARHEDGMVVIGFQKPEGEQRDMAAWELRLPAQLQAA